MAQKKNYWFKRRRYGYGWIPTSWQGWLIVVIYVALVLAGALTLKNVPDNTFTREVGFYLGFVFIISVSLIRIGYAKGPKPKWRWGKKSTDDPKEDF